jgi:prevent-host-death family protein
MDETMSATHARIHFGEVLRRVTERQQRIIVERAGEPLAVILSLAEYRHLTESAGAEDWQQLLRRTHEQLRSDLGERTLPPVEQIIREMREERDEHIVAVR